MRNPFRRHWEDASDDLQIKEIDERHFIAQQVFFRREGRGWTQQQLAEAAAMTQAQVANIESGQANPTLRSLVKLAHAFGCGVSELCSQDGCETLPSEADELVETLNYDTPLWTWFETALDSTRGEAIVFVDPYTPPLEDVERMDFGEFLRWGSRSASQYPIRVGKAEESEPSYRRELEVA